RNKVSEAEQSLKEWVNKSEGYLAEGKGYQEVWGTTVETCNSRANAARDVASGTKEIVTEVIIERAKMNPLRDHLLRLMKKATGEVKKNVSVLNGAADAVEEARYLDRISALAMMNMRVMLENRNDSRKQHTEVLEGVDEKKRSVEREALIKRSKRVYKELNEVYHHLLVIKRRSHACAREVSNGVIATKNRILRAWELFDAVKNQFAKKDEEYEEDLKKFGDAIGESLREELVRVTYFNNKKKTDEVLFVVGRTSASAIAGAAPPHEAKKRTTDKAKLAEKVAATKKNEKERLEREKVEEEKVLRNLREERQRELERKRAEEEKKKATEERRKEQERKKPEEEKKKGKQELERKAKEEMEKKKKQKDGSIGPVLMHSPFLLLVLLCVLGCTVVC
ncbi:uncharacterized protein TM35_000281960, partial [Trypanosoma theileri]